MWTYKREYFNSPWNYMDVASCVIISVLFLLHITRLNHQASWGGGCVVGGPCGVGLSGSGAPGKSTDRHQSPSWRETSRIGTGWFAALRLLQGLLDIKVFGVWAGMVGPKLNTLNPVTVAPQTPCWLSVSVYDERCNPTASLAGTAAHGAIIACSRAPTDAGNRPQTLSRPSPRLSSS